MKELLISRTTKSWLWGSVFGVILGVWLGGAFERSRVYGDCRYAGVTRIGESAFKCEQFSKVVLLTPDEVIKKEAKK